jgi:hypothetical protein
MPHGYMSNSTLAKQVIPRAVVLMLMLMLMFMLMLCLTRRGTAVSDDFSPRPIRSW